MTNPPNHATLMSQSDFSRTWNLYDGPVRVAVAREQLSGRGQAHQVQIIRGECDHALAVQLIEAAKDSQRGKMLKGGIT